MIMKIWLESNISAHDFILEDYFKSNYDFVKNVLPDATVLVYEEDDEIKGFVGIIEESYIATYSTSLVVSFFFPSLIINPCFL